MHHYSLRMNTVKHFVGFHSLGALLKQVYVYREMSCQVLFTINTDHLIKLQDLHNLREKNNWIRYHFTVMHGNHFNQLTLEEKSSLMEVSCDGSMKYISSTYQERELSGFWLYVKREYPDLSEKATKFRLSFVTWFG